MKAVNGLEDLCDVVDITNNCNSTGSNDLLTDDQHDKWDSWLNCIQRVHQECKTPILCKLPFTQQTVDDAIRRGKSLHEVGCEV